MCAHIAQTKERKEGGKGGKRKRPITLLLPLLLFCRGERRVGAILARKGRERRVVGVYQGSRKIQKIGEKIQGK